jgi:hypothetical protein
MKKLLFSVLMTAVVIGGGAFYGGMKYGQSKGPVGFGNLSAEQRRQFQQAGANMGGAMAGRGQKGSGFANGEIISKDDKSVTVKLQDGGSKIVFFSGSTEVGKFANGTSADLSVGEAVTVSGDANQDGSITAKSIQIRPAGSLPSPVKQ